MSRIVWKSCLGALVSMGLLCVPQRVAAQNIINWFQVDCSGQSTDPWVYPSINSVLPNLTDGSGIAMVTNAPCNEWVTISNLRNIILAGSWDGGTTLTGGLNIVNSDWVYVINLAMNSPNAWRGISVDSSRNVTFDMCSSTNHPGAGLGIEGASSVTVSYSGNFSFNGGDGIFANQNSTLKLMAGGTTPIDISSNGGRGLVLDRSTFYSVGNVSITNNGGAYGLELLGHSTGLMISSAGPHTISGNPNGGIHVAETSQLSIGGNPDWGAPYPYIIQANGPVGIVVESLGQVTLFGLTQVLDHPVAGIDVYGNSQVNLSYGLNRVQANGYSTDPSRAGIRVSENSHAYLRGAEIVYNGAPGIRNLVNSTVDIAGSTFLSNLGGAVVCDGTAFVVSDLPAATLGSANSCKVAGLAGASHHSNAPKFDPPDWKSQKALSDKMRAMIPRLHR